MKLLRALGLLVLLNLAAKPLWILVENRVQDHIGHAAMGTFMALGSLAWMVAALTDMGLNQLLTRTVAADTERYHLLFPKVLALKVLLAVLYIAVLLVAGWASGYTGPLLVLLGVLGIMQVAISFLALFRANFQAFQHFGTDAVAGVADKVVLMALLLVLLYTGLDLAGYVWASAGVTVVVTVGLGAVTFGRYGWPRMRMYAPDVLEVLRMAAPVATMVLLTNINERVNIVLLEQWAGPRQTGLYTGAYRWLTAASMYMWTVLPVFYARFSATWQRHSAARQQQLFNLGLAVSALPILFVNGFFWLDGQRLFFQFGHSTPAEIGTMVQCLRLAGLGLLFNGVLNIFSTYLNATGREPLVIRSQLVAIAVHVGLSVALIPGYGAVGASVAYAAAYLTVSIGNMVLMHRHTLLHAPVGQLLRLAGAGAAMVTVWWPASLYLHWLAAAALGGLALLGASWGLGLVNRHILRQVRDSQDNYDATIR